MFLKQVNSHKTVSRVQEGGVEILYLFHSIYVILNTSRQRLILNGFGSRINKKTNPGQRQVSPVLTDQLQNWNPTANSGFGAQLPTLFETL